LLRHHGADLRIRAILRIPNSHRPSRNSNWAKPHESSHSGALRFLFRLVAAWQALVIAAAIPDTCCRPAVIVRSLEKSLLIEIGYTPRSVVRLRHCSTLAFPAPSVRPSENEQGLSHWPSP